MIQIVYTINIADKIDISNHLKYCNTNSTFFLNNQININDYTNKIISKSTRFEAWINKKLVGLVAIYCNDFLSSIAYVTNVSVLIEYRNLGISSNLLKKSMIYCKNMGFSKIELHVSTKNQTAIHVYSRLNFIIIDTFEDKFLMVNFLER